MRARQRKGVGSGVGSEERRRKGVGSELGSEERRRKGVGSGVFIFLSLPYTPGCNDGEGLAIVMVMVMAEVATVMTLEKKFDLKKNYKFLQKN